MARLVDSLKPAVERAAGFKFKHTPRSAQRSREQVRAYLINKLHQELPPARMRGIETAYRLLTLLPDTLALEPLLVDLYSEQVAGYYDPDSTTLFGVTGADRLQLRLVLAHEMVHALQGQYLPLDSILHDIKSNDRLSAAQAVLEGQATLVSIRVLSPDVDLTAQPEFWEAYEEQVEAQQDAMPVFAHAPLLIKETLLFPYLDGAQFMQWWGTTPLKDSLPTGARMPRSTEQILTPERYLKKDQPVTLRFSSGPTRMYEDGLGELEIRILDSQLRGDVDVAKEIPPIGWGGDLYGVYEMAQGAALMTNTSVTSRILGAAWPQHFNKPVAEAMYENIKTVGLPTWTEADQTLAKALQKELGNPRQEGLALKLGELGRPNPDRENTGGGSDDIGDVSWNYPTVTLSYPANIPGLPGHNWSSAIASATPIAHKGVVAGAKVQAMTVLDLLTKPELVKAAWDYFNNVQTKDVKYIPFIKKDTPPATFLNKTILDKYREEMKKYYYDPTKYPTYLDQLGIKYPTVRTTPSSQQQENK